MQAIQSEPLNLIKSPHGILAINLDADQKCRDCNSEFCIIRKFNEYQKENAKNSNEPVYDIDELLYVQSLNHRTKQNATEKLFECSICLKRFSRRSCLRTHGRLHSDSGPKFECNICTKMFKWKSNLKVHYAIHADQKFVCELCHKVFTSDKIEQHRNWHRNPQNQCQYCEKAFSNQYKVNYHIKLKHPNVTAWQCQYCSKAFDTANERRTHIYNQHNEQRFKCRFCLSTFLTQHNLTVHETKHTALNNIDTYQCEICEQHFSYKRNLYSHLMRHAQNSNPNRAQATNTNADTRKKSNNRFDCKICNRAFLHKSAALDCKHGAKHLRDKRDVVETTRENDVQVKISLVSESLEKPVIPLFELNVPQPLYPTEYATDIVMQQQPLLFVQAFTRPLDTSTNTFGQCESFNESIDFPAQCQRQLHDCQRQRQCPVQPEMIVIDDSSDGEIIIDYSLPKVKSLPISN